MKIKLTLFDSLLKFLCGVFIIVLYIVPILTFVTKY